MSGASPFATSSPPDDTVTRANIIQNNFEFVTSLFEGVSQYAIDFIRDILVLDMRYDIRLRLMLQNFVSFCFFTEYCVVLASDQRFRIV